MRATVVASMREKTEGWWSLCKCMWLMWPVGSGDWMGVTEKGLTPTGVNSLPSISLFCRHTRIHLQNFKPLNILLLSQVL